MSDKPQDQLKGSGVPDEKPDLDPYEKLLQEMGTAVPDLKDLLGDQENKDFATECLDLLDQAEAALIQALDGGNQEDFVTEAFRAIHSIKGNAGFLGRGEIEALALEAETMLDDLRRSGGGMEVKPVRFLEINDRIRSLISGGPAMQAEETDPAPGGESTGETGVDTGADSIRVNVGKLDELMDLVGELIIAKNHVGEHTSHMEETTPARKTTHYLHRITSAIQDVTMSMRLQPLDALFSRMRRLVLDLGGKTGKKIHLDIYGGECEVDKSVVEHFLDPLVHMIRNAVDHGVELPEERRAAGKPEVARLILKGEHIGGEVLITVRDDGRGLDREKILARALAAGLVKERDRLREDEEIFQLIFEPGFSTADKVTDLSGRGVGLDVVRRNLDELNGRISISSVPGQGTTFRLFFPLTLGVMDGFLVRAGSCRYTIPSIAVQETIRPSEVIVSTTPDGLETVQIREEFCPVMRLGDLHKDCESSASMDQGIIVSVRSRRGTLALVADEVLGQQENVIKNLPGYMGTNHCYSGCTILADGEVSMIIDIERLLNRMGPLAA